MDIDRFIATNEPMWTRLAELSFQARRKVRKMSGDEIDELLYLYQRCSSQLSFARTEYRDIALNTRLTMLVAEARVAIYGTKSRGFKSLLQFFSHRFPAAVWHMRRSVLVAALVTFVPAIIMAVWLSNSPRALDVAAPEALRTAYVEEEFEDYYSAAPAAQFSTEVLVNNIRVSFLVFALGILLCIPGVYILVLNGANVGVAAGLFHAADQAPRFYGLILPHGLLELAAVVIAGAAGLRLGWAIVAPGDLTRPAAVAAQGSRSAVVVLGLTVAFIVAGLIEGFVTPSSLPTSIRVGIGAAVFITFVTYIVTRGIAASRLGMTGLLREPIPEAGEPLDYSDIFKGSPQPSL